MSLNKAKEDIEAFDALSPLTTKGDVLSHDGSFNDRLPVGADGQILRADASELLGLKWVNAGLPGTWTVEGSGTTTVAFDTQIVLASFLPNNGERFFPLVYLREIGDTSTDVFIHWGKTDAVPNDNEIIMTLAHPKSGGGATLNYDAQTGNFTVGQTITGGTSGATAVIDADADAGATGVLTLSSVMGIFQNNEIITDPLGGSATVNGVLSFVQRSDEFRIRHKLKNSNGDQLPGTFDFVLYKVTNV